MDIFPKIIANHEKMQEAEMQKKIKEADQKSNEVLAVFKEDETVSYIQMILAISSKKIKEKTDNIQLKDLPK